MMLLQSMTMMTSSFLLVECRNFCVDLLPGTGVSMPIVLLVPNTEDLWPLQITQLIMKGTASLGDISRLAASVQTVTMNL